MASSYNPLVSVALTTSKSERFLRIQMDSVLNQTYKNIEVCVSHDECGDGTVEILKEYAAKDGRVRWEYNPYQKGFIKNTEHAIEMCKGDIIFLCDHDDVWYPDRVQRHVDAYEDPTVDWVYNRTDLIDEQGKPFGYLEDTVPDYYTKERQKLLYYTWGSCIGAAETSYRAHLLKKTMPVDKYAPAHDSWIQLALWPSKSVYIDTLLQGYRQHRNNEVGWGAVLSTEDMKKREAQAIEDNMRYLRHLPFNPTLALWKRGFFLVVYVVKILRRLFRDVVKKKPGTEEAFNPLTVFHKKEASSASWYHFSIDDVLKSLIEVTDRNIPLFEHPLFAELKKYHELYGTEVDMYLFYQMKLDGKQRTLRDVRDIRKELGEAGNFIRFGPHALDYETTPYAQSPEEQALLFDTIYAEIDRFAGEGMHSSLVRLHFYSESYELGEYFKGKGVVALLSTDRPVGSHRMPDEIKRKLLEEGSATYEHARFVRTQFRTEFLLDEGLQEQEIAMEFKRAYDTYGYVVFYTHEYELERPAIWVTLEQSLRACKDVNISSMLRM